MPESNQVKWVGVRPVNPEESIPVKKGAEERLSAANTPAAKVAIGAASTLILAANAARVSFLLKNSGSITVYFRLGDNATVNDMALAAGEAYDDDDYTGIVDGIVVAGAGELRVIET